MSCARCRSHCVMSFVGRYSTSFAETAKTCSVLQIGAGAGGAKYCGLMAEVGVYKHCAPAEEIHARVQSVDGKFPKF